MSGYTLCVKLKLGHHKKESVQRCPEVLADLRGRITWSRSHQVILRRRCFNIRQWLAEELSIGVSRETFLAHMLK